MQMSTDIRVALVYEQDEGAQTLRVALANAGVTIAVECRASALDAAAILRSKVDAIIVNLDSDLEDLLDEVADALDSATQPVIFNDPAASSDLSGWDRARWMRHLAAKMKGKNDVTPPAPPGSFGIPTPPPKVKPAPIAPIAAAVPAPAIHPPAAPLAVAIAPTTTEPTLELSLADLDLMFAADEVEAPASTPVTTSLTIGEDIGDLDALFGSAVNDDHSGPLPSAPEFAELDLDTLFDAPARQPAKAAESPDTLEFDLDAIFSGGPENSEPKSTHEISAVPSELTDLDALFKEFADSQAKSTSSSEGNTRIEAQAAAAPKEPAESEAFTLDWSLEPIEAFGAEKPEPQKPVVEWRLDVPSKPIAKAQEPVAVSPAPRVAPAIPAALQESLALSDLKLLDQDDFSSDSGSGEALGELEALDLSSIDLDAPAVPAPKRLPESNDDLALLDLDFVLDLEPATQAGPASQEVGIDFSSDFSELDALFEPLSERSSPSVDLADLNRVFVLGASIGGPEAIKAFLSRLPANTQAAFVVAQHMGAEFLAMMATQLDHATALSVRCPKSGERLRHGEVIVAPANEQLDVDATGHVRLSSTSSGSPYNPSIDHLARAFADRFGDHATLILFSGMGSDAVEGGRYLTSRGGQVWVQDRASCVIASMIDSAKSQGLVRFEGTPAELADRVLQVLT